MDQTPYRRAVNYYETDKMAIVHHSNYIRYFEEARIAFLNQNGISFVQMEADGVQIPVTETSCQYRYSARFGDTLEIFVRIAAFNGVRLKLTYEVRLEDGTLCATGETGLAFLNEKGVPMSLKRRAPALYQQFLQLQAAQPPLK